MNNSVLSIYTVPMQQIRIKDIVGISPSDVPDAQLATNSPELPPAYAVEVIGEKHSCTFFTRTAAESHKWVERISEAMKNDASFVIKPDATVNRVK